MNINQKAKVDMYYLLLFWSIKETFEGNVFFINKDLLSDVRRKCHLLTFKKIRQNNKVKKQTISFLKKIQSLDISMENLSFEMITFLSLNYLVNELEDKEARRVFNEVPVIDILEFIRESYPTELKEHYKFFDLLEDKI